MQQASGTSPLARSSRRGGTFFRERVDCGADRRTGGLARYDVPHAPVRHPCRRRLVGALHTDPSQAPQGLHLVGRRGRRDRQGPDPGIRPHPLRGRRTPRHPRRRGAGRRPRRSLAVPDRSARAPYAPRLCRNLPLPSQGEDPRLLSNGPGHVGMQPLPVYDRRVGVDGLQPLAQFRFHAGGIDCDRPES